MDVFFLDIQIFRTIEAGRDWLGKHQNAILTVKQSINHTYYIRENSALQLSRQTTAIWVPF